MPAITKVLFYLDDPDPSFPFPLEVPWSDIQGHIGVSHSTGATMVPEDQGGNILRMVNFAPDPVVPSAKFGSILGICYVYENGVKSWVKSIAHRGPSSSNLDVAIGNWVNGLTAAQAKSHPNYRKPYIGYANAEDYAEYEMEPYVDPPPRIPFSATINPSSQTIRINETISFTTSVSGTNTTIQSASWSYDTSKITGTTNDTGATLTFKSTGTFTVTYKVKNTDGEEAQATATITVFASPITVNIVEDNIQIKVGDSVTLNTEVTSDQPIVSYEWDIPTGIQINYKDQNKATLKFTTPGTYTVKFSATNRDSQTGTDTASVIVRDLYPIHVDIIENDVTIQKGNSMAFHAVVTTPGTVVSRTWTIPAGIDIQSQGSDQAILLFNRLGTYTIRYDAKNDDGISGSDTCKITVVEPPKKKIGIGLFVETPSGDVEVKPSITLNDYAINKSDIVLKFRNTGESNWKQESFKVEVGQDFFCFQDGSVQHDDVLVRNPGSDFTIHSMIQDFQVTNRYSIVIKAIVLDDENQTITRFFELKWFAQSRPEYQLKIVERRDDNYKYPNMMKRNARYRGHRESEKYLSSHQEQILDIRLNHVDIQALQDLQGKLITSWFNGENEAPAENITFSAEKTFQVNQEQSSYPLIPGVPRGQFSNVVVELNGLVLTPDVDYLINNGYLIINGIALQNGTMKASYTATVSTVEHRMTGIHELQERIERLDERVGELERRYVRYENAYK
jgi:hypothetical protein